MLQIDKKFVFLKKLPIVDIFFFLRRNLNVLAPGTSSPLPKATFLMISSCCKVRIRFNIWTEKENIPKQYGWICYDNF